VCAEKKNVSAAVKPVKNVSVAAINQQQKDNEQSNSYKRKKNGANRQ